MWGIGVRSITTWFWWANSFAAFVSPWYGTPFELLSYSSNAIIPPLETLGYANSRPNLVLSYKLQSTKTNENSCECILCTAVRIFLVSGS